MSFDSTDVKSVPKKVCNDIPWEYGTNRFASQKGMGPFGGSRSIVPKVTGARSFTEVDNESIPKLAAGCKRPDPKDMPFVGGTRENVKKVEYQRETVLMKDVLDKDSEKFLSKWMQPNPNAKNESIGKRRDATTEIVGKGRHDRRGEGVLPRFQDTTNVPSVSGTGAGVFGSHNQRQITMKFDQPTGLSMDEETKSKIAVPWTTGYQNPQTQAHTGGFLKPRDVVNQTYYDEKKPMSSYRFH